MKTGCENFLGFVISCRNRWLQITGCCAACITLRLKVGRHMQLRLLGSRLCPLSANILVVSPNLADSRRAVVRLDNWPYGHRPNFPAIHLYVFPSCSSKFTQLLAALVGNVNHILKSACSPLVQKEPLSFFDRKLSKLKLYCWRESALKTPKNVAKNND